ncbi:hypothetical protein G5B38_15615 [Pseudohalocynthiibacter aestuariivivens]|uniref:Lipoprotein n=1 Tax=Roseovarius pelagicus TaxID=2980108 RepID=A0ABY6DER6_9RHOB|nr:MULTISPECIES: hypothetical protein [Rhodobacterales]QIE46833.1 hypothetical protein G5B38_15615 [Pseudohalocynthiibacter aestuariivivens]UXX84623.1 hypothetical protein N7U68_08300 [Roseovarius pelagicus]
MKIHISLIFIPLLVLGACVEVDSSVSKEPVVKLPDSIVEMAAPNQDLASVRVREDGCLWYRYAGPVETTMLPLRTKDGRPICTKVAS